jgi:transcription initiation factor IIF auxiliary subunit
MSLTSEQKIRVLNGIMIVSMTTFFLWIVLKLAGIIQTPLWLELLPLMSLGIYLTVLTAQVILFFGGLKKDMGFLKENMIEMKQDIKENSKKIDETNKKLDQLHHDFHIHLHKYHN